MESGREDQKCIVGLPYWVMLLTNRAAPLPKPCFKFLDVSNPEGENKATQEGGAPQGSAVPVGYFTFTGEERGQPSALHCIAGKCTKRRIIEARIYVSLHSTDTRLWKGCMCSRVATRIEVFSFYLAANISQW